MNQSYPQFPYPSTASTFSTTHPQMVQPMQQAFLQQPLHGGYGQPFHATATGQFGFGQQGLAPQSYGAHVYSQQAFGANPFAQPQFQQQQAMTTAPHQPYHLANYQGNVMGHDRYLNQDAIIPSQRSYPQAQSGSAFGGYYGSH